MRWTSLVIALALALALCRCGRAGATAGPVGPGPEVTAFLRQRSIAFDTDDPAHPSADLQAFKAMVGPARVVALGEGTHGTAEFFRMKHRLLRLLIEEMGFTAFGIEASFPDTEPINDYVLDGRSDPRAALARQGFWTWDTEEVLDLVRWMRAYNQAHAAAVSFRGFDMQHPAASIDAVLAFLRRVDSPAAARAERLYAPYRAYADWVEVRSYKTAPAGIRALCHSGVVEVEALVSGKAAPYEAASSAREYRNALHNAHLVVQGEALYSGTDKRDALMAENALWLLEQSGPDARTALWAHNAHVRRVSDDYESMGAVLDRRLGAQMLVVGFALGRGACSAVAPRRWSWLPWWSSEGGLGTQSVPPPIADSYESAFAGAGLPRFALDLRDFSRGAPDWLVNPHLHRGIGAIYDSSQPAQYYRRVRLDRLYDVIVYFDDTRCSRVYR